MLSKGSKISEKTIEEEFKSYLTQEDLKQQTQLAKKFSHKILLLNPGIIPIC